MSRYTPLIATALLACSLSTQAAPPPTSPQPGLPTLLTSLGTVVNPLLQPVLSITGPLVGGLVRTATPPLFSLLGSLTQGPVNGLLGNNGLVSRLPSAGARSAEGGLSAFPPLSGLE